jgi:hypothetical protein
VFIHFFSRYVGKNLLKKAFLHLFFAMGKVNSLSELYQNRFWQSKIASRRIQSQFSVAVVRLWGLKGD